MSTEVLQVKKLTENAYLPVRGTPYAAGTITIIVISIRFHVLVFISMLLLIWIGFDLSSAYDTLVPARGKVLVKTDLSIAIPEGTYARIGNTWLVTQDD